MLQVRVVGTNHSPCSSAVRPPATFGRCHKHDASDGFLGLCKRRRTYGAHHRVPGTCGGARGIATCPPWMEACRRNTLRTHTDRGPVWPRPGGRGTARPACRSTAGAGPPWSPHRPAKSRHTARERGRAPATQGWVCVLRHTHAPISVQVDRWSPQNQGSKKKTPEIKRKDRKEKKGSQHGESVSTYGGEGCGELVDAAVIVGKRRVRELVVRDDALQV